MVLVIKNQPANVGDTRDKGSVPELGRSPGGGHGQNPNAVLCMWNMETEMPRGKRLESKVNEQTKMMVRNGAV